MPYPTSFSRAYLRKRATQLHEDSKDTCIITRPGVAKVIVEGGKSTRVMGDEVIYEGVCRLIKPDVSDMSDYQGIDITQIRTHLALPWDAGVPQLMDVVKMLSSDDPMVVGTLWTVQSTDIGGGLRGSRVVAVTSYKQEKPDD